MCLFIMILQNNNNKSSLGSKWKNRVNYQALIPCYLQGIRLLSYCSIMQYRFYLALTGCLEPPVSPTCCESSDIDFPSHPQVTGLRALTSCQKSFGGFHIKYFYLKNARKKAFSAFTFHSRLKLFWYILVSEASFQHGWWGLGPGSRKWQRKK